jgi:hypothetical protein
MSNVTIAPHAVLLTSGQAVTFEATNSDAQPIPVNWSLNPPIGTLVTPGSGNLAILAAGPATPSATYIAPPLVASAQTIAVLASTVNDSASAAISLTSDTIAIVPVRVDLKAEQEQQFVAIVAGAPDPEGGLREKIIWILSPPLGSLSPEKPGWYKAPPEVPDSATVSVIATSPTLGRQAVATVNLASPPWQGPGVNVLGAYLLLVFSLVFLMVGLWPPALPSPDTAKANRIEAERTLEAAQDRLKSANLEAARALEERKKAAADLSSNRFQPAGVTGVKTDGNGANLDAANTTAGADDIVQQVAEARDDLKNKRATEETVNDPGVNTRLAGHINRELDLLWLVLLAGTLGSFLHTAQSYSEYVGNRTLKISWAWWYSFRPFIGAGLALVFYAALRGGFMAIATGSNAKASELNAFGVVSIAAMVGMFSKAATVKLGEVFDTVFKSDSAPKSKDPVVASSQTSNQPAGKAPTAGTGVSTATK